MYILSYSNITHCAQQAQQAAAALQQQVTAAYTVTVTQQTNSYYAVIVERVFKNKQCAINVFNNTVAQYCEVVAQYIDDEDYPASCYVFDEDWEAVY